ncbi:TonB-dependent receptor domain-containing protein [Capnocytophaga catalasegens]|nr:TonB-dependent receptor [Capnocytophaga catalasegens]
MLYRIQRKKAVSMLIFAATWLWVTASYAQDEKLGTKVIDIVKPYTPTVADAIKQRETTPAKDSVTVPKKKINYTIYSVPVASTFVPDKGRVSQVPTTKGKKENYYDSYVALGFGSYTTFLGDAYIALPINKESDFSIDAQHHSSQNNVKGIDTDSNFSNTDVQGAYRYADRDYSFGASVNVGHRLMHWYGIEEASYLPVPNGISLRQNYLDGGLKAYFGVNNSVFRRADILLQGIKDDYDSTEFQVQFLPSLAIPFGDEHLLGIDFDVNYLNGNFNRGFATTDKITYQWTLLGIRPAYHFTIDDFSAKVGAGVYYASGKEESQNKLKVFPDVEVAYNAFGENFIIYAGIGGNLEQITYRGQSRVNPFVSPTLNIKPMHTTYDVFGGIKGKLVGTLSYDVKAHYGHIKNLPMFQANPKVAVLDKPYHYDNTYAIIYDDAMVYGLSADVKGAIADVFTLGVSFKMDSFVPEIQKEAWNIPLFQSTILTDFQVLPNWYLGADLFYVGDRKDIKHNITGANQEIVTLDGYFDVNLHTDYTIAKQWTIFVNANNLTAKNYLRWTNYPVQGLQILGGVKYQF